MKSRVLCSLFVSSLAFGASPKLSPSSNMPTQIPRSTRLCSTNRRPVLVRVRTDKEKPRWPASTRIDACASGCLQRHNRFASERNC